jgi:hypothetical protein
MNHYIQQLIDNFRQRRTIIRFPDKLLEGIEAKDTEEMAKLAFMEEHMTRYHQPIAEITGIEQVMLPLANQLTNDQATLLAHEIELLLHHFNLYPAFPPAFPGHLRYPLLRGIWQKKYLAVTYGEVEIGFCTLNDWDCPFPGYCTWCADFRREAREKYGDDQGSCDETKSIVFFPKPPSDQ